MRRRGSFPKTELTADDGRNVAIFADVKVDPFGLIVLCHNGPRAHDANLSQNHDTFQNSRILANKWPIAFPVTGIVQSRRIRSAGGWATGPRCGPRGGDGAAHEGKTGDYSEIFHRTNLTCLAHSLQAPKCERLKLERICQTFDGIIFERSFLCEHVPPLPLKRASLLK